MDGKTLGDVFQLVNDSVQDERRKLAERLRRLSRLRWSHIDGTEIVLADDLDDIIAGLEGETGGEA